MDYKWELRAGSKKEICPQCGQKRFVPYVATADHKTLAGAEYGRCDREQNCCYHRYPNGKSTEGIEPKPLPKLEPLRFYPAAIQVSTNTNLFRYACRLVGVSRAIEVWKRYMVGSDDGRTVFWQIDYNGEVRSGKSIPYLENGHRDKLDKYPATWLHKNKRWNGYFHGEELQQCFFGEHLLKFYPDKPVAIVESEKTAIMLSAFAPDWIWIASGGSQGLKNVQKNEVLKERTVLLIPDNGYFFAWRQIARKYGWEITRAIEECPAFEGCDILDMVEHGVFNDYIQAVKKT